MVLTDASAALAQNVVRSTFADQTALQVTITTGGKELMATPLPFFVRDTRRVTLPAGEQDLQFLDIAANLNEDSVFLRVLGVPGKLDLLEQSFQKGVVAGQSLLDSRIGKQVRLFPSGTDLKEGLDATVISGGPDPVFKTEKGIYLGYKGLVVLPQIPDKVMTRSTLSWHIKNNEISPQDVEVNYMATGLFCLPEYVFVLRQNDTVGDLLLWLGLRNESGLALHDALVKVIPTTIPRQDASQTKSPSQTQVPIGEVKRKGRIFDLPGKYNLSENETRRIRLFEARSIPLQKEFIFQNSRFYTLEMPKGSFDEFPKAFVLMKKDNKNFPESKLLPGEVMVYRENKDGALELQLPSPFFDPDDSPSDIRVDIGVDDKIVLSRSQTDFKVVQPRVFESEWKLIFRNNRSENVRVGVIESIGPNWELISSSQPGKKIDNDRALRFDVDIPAGGAAKVTYRVLVRF